MYSYESYVRRLLSQNRYSFLYVAPSSDALLLEYGHNVPPSSWWAKFQIHH